MLKKDWRQEEKGMTEHKMFGWHHRLNGHEFGQTLGDSRRQRGLLGSLRVRHSLVTAQHHKLASYPYNLKIAASTKEHNALHFYNSHKKKKTYSPTMGKKVFLFNLRLI